MRSRCPLPTLATMALTVLAGTAGAQRVSFADDVLPILSDRCFHCHGPDAGARKADLRLDERDDVVRERTRDDGRRVAIVVPGDPGRSELYRRITATGDGAMPPRHTGLKLTTAEVATLRRWIEQGAGWSQHWAFTPIAPAPPPNVATTGRAGNAIDRFVHAQLDAHGLQPNQPANPSDLLRRVSLDLTGLPPTAGELAAFVADPSDASYRRHVDRLLASPHYGERMAWPWLEASRYADTDGFQNDPTRIAWPWRDWLVRSLNDNVPFDRLTIEMLAGDLLDDPTPEQRLATGFLRNNAHNGEGGRIPEETRVENTFDRTETVATVWLGMTMECARCHDHKYDPIAQRDYYRLFAFFNQSSETGRGRSNGVLAPSMRYVPAPHQQTELAALREELRALEAAMFAADPALAARQARWEAELAARLGSWHDRDAPIAPGSWSRSEDYRAAPTEMFAHRFAPEQPNGADATWQPAPELVDGELLQLPKGIYTTYFRRVLTVPTARRVRMKFGSDDAIKVWCDGRLVLQNDVRRAAKADQERVEIDLAAGEHTLLVKIVNTGGLGGIWFALGRAGPPGLPFDAANALRKPAAERSADQQRLLTERFRSEHVAGFDRQLLRAAELRGRIAALEQGALTVSVMDHLPVDRRRATPVYARGDYQAPGEHVTAGTPSFLPPLQPRVPATPDRLDLARWLVSGDNALVARVAANRAWQTLFGRGLVATSEDFGRQGERPVHRELLDWLARRYVDSGWNTKELHRLIVTSATYRQSGSAAAAAFQRDPDNTLLARYPRRRLPAWMLRDQALALGGLLVDAIGGQPVRPYQPPGIWAEATFGFIKYEPGSGEQLYRRSIYTFWRRIVGPTMFFDTKARQQCVVRGSITNTPLHALTTMNETGFVEAARGLAQRAMAAATAPPEQIAWLFAQATARPPERDELERLHRRYQGSRARFTSGELDAGGLLAVGASPVPADADRDALAALTVIASIVCNLDEVLCRP